MGQANNGKATASLVLGIISIVCVMGTFYTSWIGLILGILAIILGNKARKETPGGIATAGFVCGDRRHGAVRAVLCGLHVRGRSARTGGDLLAYDVS